MTKDRILKETLVVLKEHYRQQGEIATLHLGRYFTTVRLTSDAVGAAMSYYSASDQQLQDWESVLYHTLSKQALDPSDVTLLPSSLPYVFKEQNELIHSAILLAFISALSSDILKGNNAPSFSRSSHFPTGIVENAETAAVVGFGGMLDTLASMPHISRLHIADLGYSRRTSEMDQRVQLLSEHYPNKRFSVSDKLPREEHYDVVSITGSSLSNDTLDRVLDDARNASKILLQGQSASIVPDILFQSGVDLVVTTIKPSSLADVAAKSYGGSYLRTHLEGASLPWIYLLPTGEELSSPHSPSAWASQSTRMDTDCSTSGDRDDNNPRS